MFENQKTKNGRVKPLRLLLYVVIAVAGAWLIGFVVNSVARAMPDIIAGNGFSLDLSLLFAPTTWLIGIVAVVVLGAIYFITNNLGRNSGRGLFRGDKEKEALESVL